MLFRIKVIGFLVCLFLSIADAWYGPRYRCQMILDYGRWLGYNETRVVTAEEAAQRPWRFFIQ